MTLTPEIPGAPRRGALRDPRPRRARALALLVVTALLPLAACGDDPFEIRWTANPDTVLLYSISRQQLNLPSAFSFNPRRSVRVEDPDASGNWDVAVDTRGGALVLVPPLALGINSRARIASLRGMDFDDVREAPLDTAAYVSDQPVAVEPGTIYVVQSREISGTFSICVYYAKLEPLVIDPVEGILEFVFDASPVCNDPRLVPPD